MEGLVTELMSLLKDPETMTTRVGDMMKKSPSAEDLGSAISAVAQFALASKQSVAPLCTFAEQLFSKGVLTPDELSAVLGREERNFVIPSSVQDVKTERRLRTRYFFTQKRFNLQPEETEGYSKLSTILYAAENSEPADGWVDEVLAIVSTFNLDINRAIEAVLNLGARRMTRERDPPAGPNASALGVRDIRLPQMIATLLQEFPPQHVTAVLGATLLRLQETASNSITREATLLLVFVLVREGRVPIDQIWPYLDDGIIQAKFAAYEAKLKTIAKSGNNIGKDADGKPKRHSATSLRDAFSLEVDAENGPMHGVKSHAMDLLYLCIARMRWEDAKRMIGAMSGDGGLIDVASHPPVAFALSNLAFAAIQPALKKEFPDLYSENCKIGKGEDGFLAFVSSSKELFGTGRGEKVREILFVLGPHARRSPPLLFALCRLMEGEPVNDAMKSIMREVILPALSLTQSNASLANIIWSVLRRWEHPLRWELYGYLKHEVPLQCAAAAVIGARASYETRSIMKRLTVDNYRTYQSTFAKITHGQALTVFSVMIRRTQGYSADKVTITPFVDALKSCSLMSYDMLLYIVVDELSNTLRKKIKDDGINLQGWFSATSLFLGVVLRKLKVSSESVSGCLHFLFRKIVVEEDMDLIPVLNQIILAVTDIDVERNLTSRQQAAQAGGPVVRSTVQGALEMLGDGDVPGNVMDFRRERDRVSAIHALKSAFYKTGMHCSISLAVAQLAARGSFHLDNKSLPLKMNGGLHDGTRNALRQFSAMIDLMDSLESSRSYDDVDFWEPFREIGITKMVKDLRILAPDALSLMRPVLPFKKTDSSKDMWHVEVLPADVRTMLAPELYRVFWTLSLGDLEVPEALYDAERNRLRKAISTWDNFLRSRRGDRKQMSRAESEVSHFKTMFQKLEKERKDLIAHRNLVESTLREEIASLQVGIFLKERSVRESAATHFLQRCILPRALSSAYDATYCSKFVLLLLSLDVPAVDLPAFYSLVTRQAPVLLLSCTENDAANFGVFLREILSTLEKWRCNKNLFEKEASKTPLHGFRKVGQGGRRGEPWRHEEYCEYLFELHQSLTAGLCKLLRCKEYLHARNTLSVLHIVSDVYPKVKENAVQITEAVAFVKKSEKDDLRLAATGVFSKLENGHAKRVPEHFFKLKPKSVNTANVASSAAPPSSSKHGIKTANAKGDSQATPKTIGAKAEATLIKSESVLPTPKGAASTRQAGSSNTGQKAAMEVEGSEKPKSGGRPSRGVKRGHSGEGAERRSPLKRRASSSSIPGQSGTGSGAANSGRQSGRSPVEAAGSRRPASARDAKRPRTPEQLPAGASNDSGANAPKRQRTDERPAGNPRRERPGSGSGRDRGDREGSGHGFSTGNEHRDRNDRDRMDRRGGPGGNSGGAGPAGRNVGNFNNTAGGRNFPVEEVKWLRSGRLTREERQFENTREPFRYPPAHHRRGYEPDARNDFYGERGEDGRDRRGDDRRGNDRRGNEDHRGDDARRGDGRHDGDERRRGPNHRRSGRNSGNRNSRKSRG